MTGTYSPTPPRLQARLRGHRVEAARLALPLRRSPDWLKMKNPAAPAVRREADEDWGRRGWRKRRPAAPTRSNGSCRWGGAGRNLHRAAGGLQVVVDREGVLLGEGK